MYCYQSNVPKAPVSSFGFGTSRISPEPRDKDIGLVGEERRTLTSKSYLHSFCCVTIWFVVPTNQLLAASVSICWRGMYGWKNASWENILSAVHGIWWGGALALLTPMVEKKRTYVNPWTSTNSSYHSFSKMLVSLYSSFVPIGAIRNRVDLRGVLLISRNEVSWNVCFFLRRAWRGGNEGKEGGEGRENVPGIRETREYW